MRLPAAPIAVEPPAPVEPIGDAGDSWDTWTDESRWTVTEEARPTYREKFVPTPEDESAALMFADRRNSCLEGESGPPIGDKSWPRRPAARGYAGTGMSDHDVYRPGCSS